MQLFAAIHRLQTIPALARAGIVVAGYVVSILLAAGVVSLYISQIDPADYDASSGMYAFGEMLVFLAVFGTVSIVPTGLAMVFLKQRRGFWIALCVVALAVAGTSLGVVASTVLAPLSTSLWTMLAFPRIFLSPFLAAAFGLAALVAPEARFRWWLLAAAGIECASSVYGFFHWFAPLLHP